MIKWNRKLILLLVLVLIVTILSGCKNKAPEGINQEFYKNIVNTSNEIMKEIPNIKKEDVINNTTVKFQSYSEFCDKYYSDYESGSLTIAEEKAFKALISTVLYVNTDLRLHYEKGEEFPSKNTVDKIEKLAELLEIDIEYKFN